MPEFPRTTPLLVNISNPIGSVEVVAEERDSVNVTVTPLDSSRQDRESAENTRIDLRSDELVIEAPKGSGYMRQGTRLKIEVQTPTDSDVRIVVASATVKCTGQYRTVNINSASGEVEVENATGNVRLRTSSGDSRINNVGGEFNARTASGELIANDVVGPTVLRTASGHINIASVQTDVRSRSSSGDLRIDSAHTGVITAKSASGKVSVGIVADTRAKLDLDSISGSVMSHIDTPESQPDSVELTVHVRTKSGDIEILRASESG
jgi:DUF4097 and DUF4098 domain-containing protein YvlB